VIADFLGAEVERAQLGDAFRVEARIVVWESDDALKISSGCLFRHGSAWAVYLVKSTTAELRQVTIGHNNGLEAEVLDGLQAGDQVILHPSDKLRDGAYILPRASES
jgi:HlyD family secretion protein